MRRTTVYGTFELPDGPNTKSSPTASSTAKDALVNKAPPGSIIARARAAAEKLWTGTTAL